MDNPPATWHRVALGDLAGSKVAELSTNSIVNKFSKAFQAKGVVDPEFFHDAKDHSLYFSPEASAIVPCELREFSAVTCSQPKNLGDLKKVGKGI
jgi:hypothetical protein